MAKRKKRRRKPFSARRSLDKIREEIEEAMALVDEEGYGAAREALLALLDKYPRNKEVLLAVLELAQMIQDWPTYAYYGEQLLPLERGDDRAQTLNNLVFACLRMEYPAMAWQYATELVSKHSDFYHIEQVREMRETTERLLTEEAEILFDDESLSMKERFDVMVQHDQVRFYTESFYPEEAIETAKTLLKKMPDLVPVMNNLSLAYFSQGKIAEAVETAEEVLAKDDDNLHALGNLVRYRFLSAQFDEAQAAATRLLEVQSDKPDAELKRAEAFSYLGEDKEVWAAYERAIAQDVDQPPTLFHLAAVASYRMGNEADAWRLWEKAVEVGPEFELAVRCLEDRDVPVGERDVPWYWPYNYWFPVDMRALLEKHIGNLGAETSNKAVERGVKNLLAERPHLPLLFPHILERGDGMARNFVLRLIRIAETPELLRVMYDFALGRWGSDEQRMEAMQFISQNHPSMLPEDKMVPMWVNGQQTELMMLGFEITEEPVDFEGVAEEILDKYHVAYEHMMADEPDAAVPLLKEIIADDPDFYLAYNQLAAAYEMQGRLEEARTLVEEAHERFPDYLFTRIGLARMLIREGEVEEARELVLPLLRRHELHISEFRALAKVQMDLALADELPEAARSWLDMWRQLEEDHPELMQWEMRIEGPDKFMKGLGKLLKRGES